LGAAVVWSAVRRGFYGRVVASSLLGIGVWHLCQQTHHAIHEYRSSEERNPYVYSHTTSTLLSLLDSVRKLEKTAAEKLPDTPFSVQVINQDEGWPLPWYLRNKSHAGFQSRVPEVIDAPVIIVDSDLAGQLESKLGDRVYNKDTISSLRPGIVLVMFVEEKLWQEHIGYLSPQLQKP
jgi:predicted membrane-bound mannosyltransferase